MNGAQAQTADSHKKLVKPAIEKAHLAYRRAVNDGAKCPVVFVLDLRDEMSLSLALVSDRAEEIEKCIQRARAAKVQPVQVCCLPRPRALYILEGYSPQLAVDLRHATASDRVMAVVAVTEGNISMSVMPVRKERSKVGRRRPPR